MSEPRTQSNPRGRPRGATRGGAGAGSRGGAPNLSSSSSGIPSGSVSKIKAQLRQTRRLLDKPDLNPDVRVTSERRLAALQDELAKAEQSNLEKKMVTKYRGIKFFERQKVLRRIKQAKRTLESEPESIVRQEQLKEARLDLYYILRYPKTEKYLALYPENSYIPFSPTAPQGPSSSSAFTPRDPSSSSTTTTKEMRAKKAAFENELKRWRLRQDVVDKVDRGEWQVESERGDLAIEGEEDEPTPTPSLVVAAAGGVKRTRRDDRGGGGDGDDDKDDAREDGEARGEAEEQQQQQKKRKVEPRQEEDAGGEAGQEAGGEEGEGKKLNRKQKKALRRAQEAAGVVVPPPPAETATKGRPAEGNGTKGKGKKASKKEEEQAVASKQEKLALEDDFFA